MNDFSIRKTGSDFEVVKPVECDRSFDSTGAMAHAWFGTPGTEAAVEKVFGPQGKQAEPVAWLVTGGRIYRNQAFTDKSMAEGAAMRRQDGSIVVPLYASLDALKGE